MIYSFCSSMVKGKEQQKMVKGKEQQKNVLFSSIKNSDICRLLTVNNF